MNYLNISYHRLLILKALSLAVFILLFGASISSHAQNFNGWKTDLTKKSIDLSELISGGPPKDGIPSIDDPNFISIKHANEWVEASEPVIAFELNGIARAYPLQVLIWHEIVNDQIGDTPLLITFCPLCYSAIVFDRRINNETHEFGVSGFLRHSDMIMFDRKTESLWQQFTGEAIVGKYTGKTLKILPSQIMSFKQFSETYPNGKILSKETGYNRSYGQNPYAGYDNVNNTPFFMNEPQDGRLKPMQKVIGIQLDSLQKAYPYSVTKDKIVINDDIGQKPVVIFHTKGARSAMDAARISQSRKDGTTGAFSRVVDDQILTFTHTNNIITDNQTGSRWDISGKAVSGPLEGKLLKPLISGDYFAFAWLVFWPETEIYQN
ncbi:MAG: DUF3179 domain-containing protein [Gracilimonas sp.]|nr:DUF3179 domain-containing protein [Gracilimonas sp.]